MKKGRQHHVLMATTKKALGWVIPLMLSMACTYRPTDGKPSMGTSEQIAEMVGNYLENGDYTGNILVAKGDSILYENSTGWANIEDQKPNTVTSIFEIASISKSFTATLVLQLVEEQRLSLNDTLGKFSSLGLRPQYHNIRIEQLLNHTSGMFDHDEVEGFFRSIAVRDQEKDTLTALLNQAPLLFDPGQGFRYSNFGYNMLALIIEDITGKSFGQNLEERIFKPLQLNSTYRYEGLPNFVQESVPYQYNIFGESMDAAPYSHSVDIGAGGIYSTLRDLLRWSNSFDNNELISQGSKRKMFLPNSNGWGFGWEQRSVAIDSTTHVDYLSHGALANGYWGLLTKVSDYTIVLLSNHRPNDLILNNVRPIPIRLINENIVRIVSKLPVPPYRKSLAFAFSRQIRDGAFEELVPILSQAQGKYHYEENEFMVLGYELLELGQHDKGIKVFRYMLERTKNLGLVNECLGDAHFYYRKDLQRAKDFYVTALTYSSESPYLQSQLDKIDDQLSH